MGMLHNQPLNIHHHNQFWYFVDERQHIFYKRFVLEKKQPWTKDKTMRQFFFTNVYRQLDRGTLYLTKEIYPHLRGSGAEADALFSTLIYRLFNHIPTWTHMMMMYEAHYFVLGGWKWKEVAKELKRWRKKGNQVFTSAFTVTGNPFGGFPDKIDNICWLIDKLQDILGEENPEGFPYWQRIMESSSMERAFNRVKKLPGFGAFLAYEIVIDLNYYKGDYWGEDTFVNPGPGARRGINHIFPKIRSVEDYKQAMDVLRRKQREYLPAKFPYTDRVPRLLTLRNIEHSLCEYQKYVKRKENKRGGRARKFTGPSKRRLPGSGHQGTRQGRRRRA
jgi:hypothetical protein